jgi:hypothetical protein
VSSKRHLLPKITGVLVFTASFSGRGPEKREIYEGTVPDLIV